MRTIFTYGLQTGQQNLIWQKVRENKDQGIKLPPATSIGREGDSLLHKTEGLAEFLAARPKQ